MRRLAGLCRCSRVLGGSAVLIRDAVESGLIAGRALPKEKMDLEMDQLRLGRGDGADLPTIVYSIMQHGLSLAKVIDEGHFWGNVARQERHREYGATIAGPRLLGRCGMSLTAR